MADLDKFISTEDDTSEVDTHAFVVIIPRHTGYMQVTYFMIDPKTRSILPKARSIKWPRLTDFIDFRICVLKNVIYVIGGREKSSGRCVRQTLKYDPFVGRWRDCANLKKARACHSATVLDGKIYVIGGETNAGELLDSCEYYEPLMDEWHNAEKLLGPRKDHACVVKDEKLYLSGGTSKTEPVNDNVWVFKKYWPSRAKPEQYYYEWFPFKDVYQRTMSCRLAKHCSVISRGKIFFLAGDKKNPKYEGGFRRESRASHDILKTSKKKAKPLITSRGIEAYKIPSRYSRDVYLSELNVTATSVEKVTQWDMGGKTKAQNDPPPEKRRWITTLPPSPIARTSAASTVVGNKIYLLGGHTIEDDSKSVNIVQYYHTKKEKWVSSFSIGDGNFRDVDCAVINVPITNKDFVPVEYGDCKWVLW